MTTSSSRTAATALFVIDVQVGLARSPTQVPDADELCATLQTVLDDVRRFNRSLADKRDAIQIVFVQHDDEDADDGLAAGKPTWEVVFEPRQDDGEWLIHKSHGDVFTSNADLAQRLVGQGRTHLAMCGIQSDFCVRKSTLGALRCGVFGSVTVLSGAHSTYPTATQSLDHVKDDVERQLVAHGAHVVPWQEWLAQMTKGDAMH